MSGMGLMCSGTEHGYRKQRAAQGRMKAPSHGLYSSNTSVERSNDIDDVLRVMENKMPTSRYRVAPPSKAAEASGDEGEMDENGQRIMRVFPGGAIKQSLSNKFTWNPSYYQVDVESPEFLESLNTESGKMIGWRERADDQIAENSKIAFAFPWPEDVHITQGELRHTTLLFRAPHASSVEEFCEHANASTGEIEVAKFTKAMMSKVAECSDIDHTSLHAIVYSIVVSRGQCSLPMDYTVALTTGKHGDETMPLRKWSSSTGIHSSGHTENVAVGHYDYFIPRRWKTDSDTVLYMADPDVMNSADFSRWVNVDTKMLWKEYHASVSAADGFCHIQAPNAAATEATSILQFLAVTELNWFVEVARKRAVDAHHKNPKSVHVDLADLEFDKPEIVEKVGSDTTYIHINAADMYDLIKSKLDLLDRRLLVMGFSDVRLALTPIDQTDRKWKKQQEQAIENGAFAEKGSDANQPSAFFEVRITWEPYTGKQDMMPSASAFEGFALATVASPHASFKDGADRAPARSEKSHSAHSAKSSSRSVDF
jgi:hypothetical protein